MNRRHCDSCDSDESVITFPAPNDKYYGYWGSLEGKLDRSSLKVIIDVKQGIFDDVDLCRKCFIKLLESAVEDLKNPVDHTED